MTIDATAALPAISMHLTSHVRLADVDGDLVFLDTRADSYLCLPRSSAAAVQRALTTLTRCQDSALEAELIEAGLVTYQVGGWSWTGNLASTACADLSAERAPVDVKAIAALSLSVASAVLAFVRGPASWRRRRPSPNTPSLAADAAQRFMRLRPWIPASGRCLPLTLLMREFLAREGVETDWVFGVRTHPFDAHCWLEHDGTVLSDHLDHVGCYVPIWRL